MYGNFIGVHTFCHRGVNSMQACMHRIFHLPLHKPTELILKGGTWSCRKPSARGSNTHTVCLKCWHGCLAHRSVYISGYFKHCSWTSEENTIGLEVGCATWDDCVTQPNILWETAGLRSHFTGLALNMLMFPCIACWKTLGHYYNMFSYKHDWTPNKLFSLFNYLRMRLKHQLRIPQSLSAPFKGS